jgi:hypothetical protein
MQKLSVALDISGNGDNTLVTGVTGKTIRVMGWEITTTSVAVVLFTDGATSGASGVKRRYTFNANGGTAGVVVHDYVEGMFDLTAGNALVANLSAGVHVFINVDYILY